VAGRAVAIKSKEEGGAAHRSPINFRARPKWQEAEAEEALSKRERRREAEGRL